MCINTQFNAYQMHNKILERKKEKHYMEKNIRFLEYLSDNLM